jgi:hypothetical protein
MVLPRCSYVSMLAGNNSADDQLPWNGRLVYTQGGSGAMCVWDSAGTLVAQRR